MTLTSPPCLFLDAETTPSQRKAVAERLVEKHPQSFAIPEQALSFLRSIHLPASLRWSFLNNGKAGTSTSRRFLFQLEFGVPLSAVWHVPQDINPDGVVHNLQGSSGILRAAVALPTPMAKITDSLRLTTVRHPASRAISAFEYLCKSHDMAHSWFAQDRLRMNAVAGFDWGTDCRTSRGFAKFLDYLMWSKTSLPYNEINPHWRPQIDNIVPTVFHPEIIGRVEDMPAFFHAVAERLDESLPSEFDLPPANQQTYTAGRDWLSNEACMQLETIFAQDYTWLGYQPDEWRKAPA